MKFFILIFALYLSLPADAQKPANGVYNYKISWDEFGGKSLGGTCMVEIKGDSIRIIHDGNKSITGIKGEILEEGIIMKHRITKKWIIGHTKKDIDAKEIGGCGSGPTIISFRRKIWFGC